MRQSNGTARGASESAKARRDRVVLDHPPPVKAIAVRVHESLPVHVDLDDLIHAGILGLFDAATKYDPEKQVVFQSYAKHRIRGAILDSLRQLDWASRDLRKRQKQLDAATRELSAKLGRAPTELEVAEALGVDVERWRQMLMELRTVGLVTASSPAAIRRRSTAGIPGPPGFPAGPDVPPRGTARSSHQRHAVPAGALSEGGVLVLHQRTHHEGNRGHPGSQREPRLADPQIRSLQDGCRAALRRDSFGAGVLKRRSAAPRASD